MRLIYTPAAAAEQEGAATYYRIKSPKAALEFRSELKSVIRRILASPEQFLVIEGNVRRALMQKFPYNIFLSSMMMAFWLLASFMQAANPSPGGTVSAKTTGWRT